MNLIEINHDYIITKTIKSFRVYHCENYIGIEIFNGEKYTNYFEIFEKQVLEDFYLQNKDEKAIKTRLNIDMLMQELCKIIGDELGTTLCMLQSKKEDLIFRLSNQINETLEKSQLFENINKLIKEYENDQSNKGFLKRFFKG